MGSESLQSKLDRVRRPRVHIKYEVETDGAMLVTELPFVVGVLADLSGQPKEPLKALKDREFQMVDKENFGAIMEKAGARAALKVPNKLADDNSNLSVELNFKSIEDFDPVHVAEQVEPLRKLLEMRRQLDHLLSKTEGNDKLVELLGQVLNDMDKAKTVAQQLGVAAEEKKE